MSQYINDSLSGKPFGDGIDGNRIISSNTTFAQTTRGCSGTVGTNTLNLASSGFSNGDLIWIHQSRGNGVGQWEINRITSGGGTASLTLQRNLSYTYIDSGASQAQVILVRRYLDM